jgi:RHS repeat-associated protein
MQQQIVSVMKKSGTGGSPVDAYSFTFANKLTNIHVGAQNANNRYWYDTAGNLVTGIVNNVTNTYAYNAQNKLACVSLVDAEAYSHRYVFTYDSLNRRVRISKTTSVPPPGRGTSQVGRYIIHDGNVPIAETDNNSLICRTFVRGAGIAEGTGDVIAEVDMSDRSPEPCFYFINHRGDTLATYRGDKTLVAKYRYDVFGNERTAYCVVNEPENAPRYTFSTKEYLADAGLYLYAYRVYDPQAGRWTQRDPIDYQDSLNLYQFCGNNPLTNQCIKYITYAMRHSTHQDG